MQDILGTGNTIIGYLVVLFIYLLMFLFIRYPKPVVELNYRRNFYFLAIVWALLMFSGNYLFYRLGVMSFLPWLNNFIHCSLWIGICLTWLYYASNHRPVWELFIHFSFTSFIIKMAENKILGTWNMDSFLGINSPYAYIIAMSLVDGFYPIISKWLLKFFAGKGKFGLYLET
ncbi:MAG: hypothetical protein ABIN67_20585 [Ferruginibacter sp.]